MTDKNACSSNGFSETIRGSIAVLSHVWLQVEALKSVMDRELSRSLVGDISLTRLRSDDQCDVSERVSTAHMWSQNVRLRKRVSKRHSTTTLAYLHFHVALDGGAEAPEDFVPFFGIHLEQNTGDELADLSDLGYYFEYGESKDDGKCIDTFPGATLGAFEWQEDGDKHPYWIAAFLPLESVNSETVRALVVDLALKLIDHGKDIWVKDENA